MYASFRDTGHIEWARVGKDAAIGGGIGLTLGYGSVLLLAGSGTASVGLVGTGGMAAAGHWWGGCWKPSRDCNGRGIGGNDERAPRRYCSDLSERQ